jgi:hypothetical protein
MGERNLFEKVFLRRQGDTRVGAIEGAIECQEMVFRFDDADMAVATITRSVWAPGGSYLYDGLITLVEEFVGGGTYALDLGDSVDPNGLLAGADLEDSGTELDAGDTVSLRNGTITGVTGDDVEADRWVSGYYAVPTLITASLVVGTAVPTEGEVRILVLFAKAPKPIQA